MKKKIITLTTDFGYDDAYVSSMKGIIKTINPECEIIDITHSIKSCSIQSANYILYSAYKYFPDGTIHIIVVDPGVGSERDAVIIKTKEYFFIAPNNGLLTFSLLESGKYKAYNIEKDFLKKFLKKKISNTFHGRDIFAPAAAMLSAGTKINDIAEKIPSEKILFFKNCISGHLQENIFKTEIIHIDKFGNLILNFRKKDFENKKILNAKIKGKLITEITGNYESIKKVAMLYGSMDFLEISVKRGSAADFFKSEIGDEVLIKFTN